jgi:hypothetical protein
MPDEVNTTGFPMWLRTLVFISVGVAAVVTIWRNIHGADWMRVVVKELTKNHGLSVKDEVSAAAQDSKEALALAKLLDERTAEMMSNQEAIKKEQADLEKRLCRFIIHQANNTLNNAHLIEEEKKRLGRKD